MNEITILAKIKFDLRDPDEAYFAQHEISAILNADVKPVRTIPALLKEYPFNKLNDEIIHIITRHLYLGEIQGYIAKVKSVDPQKLIYRPAFFKDIYLIFEACENEDEIKKILSLNNENYSRYLRMI